jgi:ketosteroid isomerase-like protein
MSEHQNAALLRRAYEAFVRGDFATLNECFHEDVVWHVPGESLVSGAHRGREALFVYLRRLVELSDGTFTAEGRDIGARHRRERRARLQSRTSDGAARGQGPRRGTCPGRARRGRAHRRRARLLL